MCNIKCIYFYNVNNVNSKNYTKVQFLEYCTKVQFLEFTTQGLQPVLYVK